MKDCNMKACNVKDCKIKAPNMDACNTKDLKACLNQMIHKTETSIYMNQINKQKFLKKIIQINYIKRIIQDNCQMKYARYTILDKLYRKKYTR